MDKIENQGKKQRYRNNSGGAGWNGHFLGEGGSNTGIKLGRGGHWIPKMVRFVNSKLPYQIFFAKNQKTVGL